MKHSILANRCLATACVVFIFALARPVSTSFAQAPNEADLKLVGEYEKKEQGIQVAPLGGDDFRVVIYAGGLPGKGWNRSQPQFVEMDRDELEAFLDDKSTPKIERELPSLNAKPPKSAIVLFDGTENSLRKYWNDDAQLVDGKLLKAGATTREKFTDYRLHLEFQTPWMPEASGQGRGNSGVYHQGRYETQVLDSFGFENEGNTCGAIYGVKLADFNASLPPLAWQTYDVEFVAARWNSEGKKLSDAKLTVWLNGQLIHRETRVPGPTTAAPVAESKDPGPLYLQDHGNPVLYRNIWIVPMDAEAAALRPRVPGYERFAATATDAQQVIEGGRLLIGELGCLACHQAGSLASVLEKKEAPILDQASTRLKAGFIADFLANVHATRPGSTMPDLFHGMSQEEKSNASQAIAAFMESTGKARKRSRFDNEAARRGEELFAKVGCAVCHGYPDGRSVTSTSVPLPELAKKYTFDGLATFLKQPHTVRPSNRMPNLNLSDDEVRDITTYLLPIVDASESKPNTRYKVYEVGGDKLPEFNSLKPTAEGICQGFDLSVANRTSNFAALFESYLYLDAEATYRFHLGSDDGSRLLIDDEVVVDNNGVHPHVTNSGEAKLAAGFHRLTVEYFQGGGEWTIDLEIESSNVVRQSIDDWLSLDDKKPPTSDQENKVDPQLIQQGKALFVTTGCAQCHRMQVDNKSVTDLVDAKFTRQPKPLDQVQFDAGCLAANVPKGLPDYKLTPDQQSAIAAALQAKSENARAPEDHVRYTMTKLNCVSCHARNGWGGPELDKLELFTSTIPEMGDESRIPPLLTGIGDKLTDGFLNKVLREGARNRPYMLVRMPQFGDATEGLAKHLIELDRVDEKPSFELVEDTESRRLAVGRQLAGVKGLACVQCHTFGNERAIGIQAINLLTMPERIRPEWFHRYMLAPTKYRPGTRMPASFPDGKSVLTTVYSGDAGNQIDALWKFLQQGNDAAVPEGLQRDQIVLEPKDRAIIYRNFFQGMSARGIAVGYPGGLNVAWDAESYSLPLLWHGQFMDASMHWRDRGSGRQRPLGDHVINFEKASPVAVLADRNAAWPEPNKFREQAKFLGYQLDKIGQPTFRFAIGNLVVSDKPEAVVRPDKDPAMKRLLTVETKSPEATFYVRLADGNKIEPSGNQAWRIDDEVEIQVRSASINPVIRESNGKKELIVEFSKVKPGFTRVEYEVRW